eukprot:m51a1_g585 hypothetical protein (790) ;mRNA; f:8708-12145
MPAAKKKTDDSSGQVLLEGRIQMLDPRPSDANRTVKATMALELCGGLPRVSVRVSGKKDPFYLEFPWRIARTLEWLRVVKEREMVVVVMQDKAGPSLETWAREMQRALEATGKATASARDVACVHVAAPAGDEVYAVPLVDGLTGAPATVDSVLEAAVNCRLHDVPTRFHLCFARKGKHCAEWRVVNSNSGSRMVELSSFAGEMVYLVPRKIELGAALSEWLSRWGSPSAYTVLSKWGSDSSQYLQQLASHLLRMNGNAISDLYSTVFRQVPPIQLSSHRLHGFRAGLEVPVHATLTQFVRISNNQKRPVILRVEHSALGTEDGFLLHCHPFVVICPEGHSRTLRLDFTCTSEANMAKQAGRVYYVVVTFTAVSKSGSSKPTGKEIPFLIPFTATPKNTGKAPQRACEGSFRSLVSLTADENISIVDGQIVDAVTINGVAYSRRTLRVQDQSFIAAIKNEIANLDAMRHPNLACIEHYGVEGSTMVVVLAPYQRPTMTLREFVCLDSDLAMPLRIKVALDVAIGLRHMHHFGACVRDFRPESVSVFSTQFDAKHFDGTSREVHAKITDLGFVTGVSALTQTKGRSAESFPYAAPDVGPTPKTDTYGFSMVLYILATRVVPFSDKRGQWSTLSALAARVADFVRPNLDLVPREWPRALTSLMTACWNADQGLRPSDDDVISALEESLFPFVLATMEWKEETFEEVVVQTENMRMPPVMPELPPQGVKSPPARQAQALYPQLPTKPETQAHAEPPPPYRGDNPPAYGMQAPPPYLFVAGGSESQPPVDPYF